MGGHLLSTVLAAVHRRMYIKKYLRRTKLESITYAAMNERYFFSRAKCSCFARHLDSYRPTANYKNAACSLELLTQTGIVVLDIDAVLKFSWRAAL